MELWCVVLGAVFIIMKGVSRRTVHSPLPLSIALSTLLHPLQGRVVVALQEEPWALFSVCFLWW
jgi:hypothetical protein